MIIFSVANFIACSLFHLITLSVGQHLAPKITVDISLFIAEKFIKVKHNPFKSLHH